HRRELFIRGSARALVNHTWNDTITPILILDVVTYRLHRIPQPGMFHDKWDTALYFITPESFEALQKYARHIRAIICKGARSLLSLLEAACSNLLEVNFVSEEKNWELGLLAELVSQNPNLCAVSIEELNGETEGQLDQPGL
ncbi:hypothetical protein BG005_004033, partial [Podila minutissima]